MDTTQQSSNPPRPVRRDPFGLDRVSCFKLLCRSPRNRLQATEHATLCPIASAMRLWRSLLGHRVAAWLYAVRCSRCIYGLRAGSSTTPGAGPGPAIQFVVRGPTMGHNGACFILPNSRRRGSARQCPVKRAEAVCWLVAREPGPARTSRGREVIVTAVCV